MMASDSSAVTAEFFHSLGDLVGSTLLALGVIFMFKKPSIRYPFGLGRSVYVFGLLSASIVAGFLFALSVSEGLRRLQTYESVSGGLEAMIPLIVAFASDAFVMTWTFTKYRAQMSNPAIKGTLIENIVDTVGNIAALASLMFLNPLVDAYGAFLISAILLTSSVNLSYKYFEVLIGRSAPKNVIGRAIKVAVTIPHIVDVNDVKSLVIEPDGYLLIMQVEVPPNLKVDELEAIREELKEKLKLAEPRIKYLIVDFVIPKAPSKSYESLLSEIVKID
jgi:cation diffusion facilitator family transporter